MEENKAKLLKWIGIGAGIMAAAALIIILVRRSERPSAEHTELAPETMPHVELK